MPDYIYKEESKQLLGIAMQLHRELGCGFKEKVYQDAFEVLLQENNILYEREKHIALTFHGVVLEHDFFYDFLIERETLIYDNRIIKTRRQRLVIFFLDRINN